MSKYLNFTEVFGDTLILSKRHKDPLGKIIYYPPWKQYVLEPLPNAVFNDECLKDIIYVIQTKNAERNRRKQ